MSLISQSSSMLYLLLLPSEVTGNAITPSVLHTVIDRISQHSGGCTLLAPGLSTWALAQGAVHRDQRLPILVLAPASPATDCFFHDLVIDLAAQWAEPILLFSTSAVSFEEVRHPAASRGLAAVLALSEGLPKPSPASALPSAQNVS
jgi:hypothetical protein